MAKKTKEAVITAITAGAVAFNFSAKRSSTSFKIDEMANATVDIDRAVDGKKDATKRYIFMNINGRPYAMEQGDLNETKGFDAVVDTAAKAKGELILLPGARLTCSGGVISWKLVA